MFEEEEEEEIAR